LDNYIVKEIEMKLVSVVQTLWYGVNKEPTEERAYIGIYKNGIVFNFYYKPEHWNVIKEDKLNGNLVCYTKHPTRDK
jgi:hypothetical protein